MGDDYRIFHGYAVYRNGKIKNHRGREIKQFIKDGRKETKLVTPKGRKSFTVSRLVYCVFNGIDIEELDKDLCVRAKDGDLTNCNIDNLELVHRRDLIQGQNHRSVARLTWEEVEEIRELYAKNPRLDGTVNQYTCPEDYYSYGRLAKKYGVSKELIQSIVKGRSWNEEEYKL